MTDNDSSTDQAKGVPPDAKNWLEWTMFAVGGLLTLATIGGLVAQAVLDQQRSPPAIIVRPGEPVHRGDRFAVPVVVENSGDETAETVRIEVVLTAAGRGETSEFEIAFLPGHGVARGTVVFETDPRRGTLHARPVGYATP